MDSAWRRTVAFLSPASLEGAEEAEKEEER
jgi:hypothetical protein